MIELNLNDYVLVRLTPHGHALLRQRHLDLCRKFPRLDLAGHAPVEDREGWSRWQLWDLMCTFGPHIGFDKGMPFDATVRIAAS